MFVYLKEKRIEAKSPALQEFPEVEEHVLVLLCNAGLESKSNRLVNFSSGDLLVLMAGSESHL